LHFNRSINDHHKANHAKSYKVIESRLLEYLLSKFPKTIRERVIKQWLLGMSRDEIAKDNDIGAGTVTAIIKDAKQEIPDIDLLRAVALVLKKYDLNLSVFASSIRIKNKLDEMGLNEDQVESFIENIIIYCFKRGLTAEKFLNIVNKVCALSDNLEMSVDQLPNHIMQQQLELEQVKGETENAKLKQHQVLQHYNVTMDVLEEYIRNKPLVETIKSHQNKLEKKERQIQYLKKELRNEQNKNFEFKYSQLVSEYELNEANKLLDRRIEPGELREIADEIYHNPSKHTDIISEIRERRDRSS
jgi:DNA-binding CsgD family transcriptional regulator